MDNHRMETEIDYPLLPYFFEETAGHLSELIRLLRDEDAPSVPFSAKQEALFRIIHQLKGSAAVVGLLPLSETLHEIENILAQWNPQKDGDDPSLVPLLLDFTAALETMVAKESHHWDGDYWHARFRIYSPISTNTDHQAPPKLDRPLVLNQEEKEKVAAWQEEGKQVYGIELFFSQEAPLRSAVAIAFHNYLKRFGEILTTAPAFDQLPAEDFAIFKAVLFRPNPLSPEEKKKITVFPVNEGVEGVYIREWSYRKEESQHFTKTLRVDSNALNKLVQRVTELETLYGTVYALHCVSRPSAATKQKLDDALQALGNNLNLLRLELINLRMIPVKQLFSRFTHAIRKMAWESHKVVKIIFDENDLRIEKEVAELLIDPLTQLALNAVAHGLETPAERKAAGKSETGTIRLEARLAGGNLLVSIGDDGRGLNRKAIYSSPLATKLHHPETAGPEENRLLKEVIFTPGFTTASKVDQLAGRGFGLSIVENNITKLHGAIEVDSEEGRGTTFTLKIPFQYLGARVLLLRSGDRLWGVPVTAGVTKEAAFLAGDGKKTSPLKFTETLGEEELLISCLDPKPEANRFLSGISYSSRGKIVYVLDPEVLPFLDGPLSPEADYHSFRLLPTDHG